MHAGRDLTECGNIRFMTPGSDECTENSLSSIVGRINHKLTFMMDLERRKSMESKSTDCIDVVMEQALGFRFRI